MEYSLRRIERVADTWLDSLNVSQKPVYYHVATGQRGCDSPIASGRAFYCFADMTVYLDIDSTNRTDGNKELYNFWLVGHETTHHLQNLAKAKVVYPPLEHQANCGAGVFVRWAIDNQFLDAVADDVTYFEREFASGPSDKEHGSARDAEAAFAQGYESGSLQTCVPISGPLAGA